MNKLFIIGNGFDLAHGLETSYTHFMLWYLKKALSGLKIENIYEDPFMHVSLRDQKAQLDIKSIADFVSLEKGRAISVAYKFTFFNELITECNNRNWVDIEYKYYQTLVKYYKRLEAQRPPLLSQVELDVKGLNNCIDLIREELRKYLLTLYQKPCKDSILNHLEKELSNINKNRDEVIFLIFNYTNTIDLYNELFQPTFKKLYIHGTINRTTTPMVFGYGDSSDQYYLKIKQLNSQIFLEKFKIYGYLRSFDYQTLLGFLNRDLGYDVLVFGHSCGTSDRLLLKSIFDNEKCSSIKLFHYIKPDGIDDYTEKTIELSRHCKLETEEAMMRKIVPFSPFDVF